MKTLRWLSGLMIAAMLACAPAQAQSWNPGVKTLVAAQITTAVTSQAQTSITGLVGMTAASLEVSFAYGSGGTSAVAVVQTSLDGGTTWRDVAYFGFTTSSAVKYANLSGLTAKATGAYAALVADGVNDGLLGDQLRVVLTTVGTYATTTLTVRAAVR